MCAAHHLFAVLLMNANDCHYPSSPDAPHYYGYAIEFAGFQARLRRHAVAKCILLRLCPSPMYASSANKHVRAVVS